MKTIRNLIFETNSSSTHSITIIDMIDYEKWKEDKTLCYDFDNKELISLEERNKIIEDYIKDYRTMYDIDKIDTPILEEDIQSYINDNLYDIPLTYKEFLELGDDDYLEWDTTIFTSKLNEQFIIFCRYGRDG
jgi:hypothetical protein